AAQAVRVAAETGAKLSGGSVAERTPHPTRYSTFVLVSGNKDSKDDRNIPRGPRCCTRPAPTFPASANEQAYLWRTSRPSSAIPPQPSIAGSAARQRPGRQP